MSLSLLFILFACISVSAEWEGIKSGKQTIFVGSDEPGFMMLNEDGNRQIETLDKDKDGKVDLIRISVFDESGIEIMEIEDHDLDGYVDTRWHKTEPQFIEIMHNGDWHKVFKSESGPYIKTDLGSLPLTTKNGYLQIETHNK